MIANKLLTHNSKPQRHQNHLFPKQKHPNARQQLWRFGGETAEIERIFILPKRKCVLLRALALKNANAISKGFLTFYE